MDSRAVVGEVWEMGLLALGVPRALQCWGRCLRGKSLLKQQSGFLRAGAVSWERGAGRGTRSKLELLGFHPRAVPLPCAQGGWRREAAFPLPTHSCFSSFGDFPALLTGLQGCCSWSSGICKAEEMESAVFLMKYWRCLNLTFLPSASPPAMPDLAGNPRPG